MSPEKRGSAVLILPDCISQSFVFFGFWQHIARTVGIFKEKGYEHDKHRSVLVKILSNPLHIKSFVWKQVTVLTSRAEALNPTYL